MHTMHGIMNIDKNCKQAHYMPYREMRLNVSNKAVQRMTDGVPVQKMLMWNCGPFFG